MLRLTIVAIVVVAAGCSSGSGSRSGDSLCWSGDGLSWSSSGLNLDAAGHSAACLSDGILCSNTSSKCRNDDCDELLRLHFYESVERESLICDLTESWC